MNAYLMADSKVMFKQNLALLCRQKGWTVAKLAKVSGVPVQTLHGWTAGKKPVNFDQVKKVATALEVSIHQIIFGEVDPYGSIDREVLEEIFSGDVRVTIHKLGFSKGAKAK